MIKVILVGCSGRMGKTISNAISNFPNLSIAAGVDYKQENGFNYPIFKTINDCDIQADVILDFSRPDSLESSLSYAKDKSLPLILCTTGYDDAQLAIIDAASKEIALFRSANMSIGINILNSVLKQISGFLYENYDIEIIEKHHNQKVDAPSGTAYLLGDTIKDAIEEQTVYVHGREGIAKRNKKEIGMHALRGGSIVGEHEVIFAGQGETIELKHTALSRDVFAIGALKACEFMYGKKSGKYNMDDVIAKR